LRRDADRLEDMLDSIDRIHRHTIKGENAFFDDELIQTWVLYHLQILGEAARSMSDDFRQQHPEINWKGIIDFRNFAVHEYFRIDLDLVWRIVTSDLPILQKQLQDIPSL
jgi:uncharacterized protein with HEPN domain